MKCGNFGHKKLGKVMEKVMNSYGMLKSSEYVEPCVHLHALHQKFYIYLHVLSNEVKIFVDKTD